MGNKSKVGKSEVVRENVHLHSIRNDNTEQKFLQTSFFQ